MQSELPVLLVEVVFYGGMPSNPSVSRVKCIHLHWDGTNSKGLSVSSGVYFLKMIVQEESGKIRHIHKQKIMLQK
ncbi:MAG: hypothetical protein U5R06_13525 [candidate division KSB1 bacterium]|nr:hypothetical protein [candidate division KSB1 bacterium]